MAVAACKQLPAYQARPLLAEALPRPGANVRVCVLRALLPLLDDPRDVLRDALLDASRGVRGLHAGQLHAAASMPLLFSQSDFKATCQ